MAGMEFVPGAGGRDCSDYPAFGEPSTIYSYIFKGNSDPDKYPDEACLPYIHITAQIDFLQINQEINGEGNIDIKGTGDFGGDVTAPTFNGNVNGSCNGNKAFDIPHVKENGKRIRHICAEGPEAGIYVRGTLQHANTIVLPEYWEGLVDPASITVTFTQIGYSQDLIFDGFEGNVIKVRSGNASNIYCFYEIWAARYIDPTNKDEKLHVVYDGETPDDYPGNNEHYLVGGWDYGRQETQGKNPVDKES
jgi:hypothetical protein